MSILESISKRRTYYQINKEIPVDAAVVKDVVEKATELVPDAFNNEIGPCCSCTWHKAG